MATVDAIDPPASLLKPVAGCADEAAPHRVLGRASIAGAGNIYQQCLSFVSGVIVARVVGAADYGIFNLARNLVDTTSILTRLGLEIGLQRYFGETRSSPDMAMRVLVLRQLRLLASMLALLPVAAAALGLGGVLEAQVYTYPGFAQALLCLALVLPFVTDLAVLGGAYRGSLKPAPAVLAECVLLPTARLIFIVALFIAGWRLWAVVLGTTLGSVLAAAWLALRARRDFPSGPVVSSSWIEARRVIKYSTVMAVAVLVTTLTSTMDVLTLGRFVPAEQLGQYSLAKILLLSIGFFAAAFNQGLGALVADRYFQGDRDGVLRVLSLAFRWITLGTLPVFAIFLFWGAQLTLLFGPSFALSQAVVAWLAGGQFVLAMFGPMGWALSMTGRHVLELRILIAGLLLATVLCQMAVPAHGQLGAAVATFCAIALVNGARMLWVRQLLRAFPFDATLILTVAAGLALGLGTRLLVAQFALQTFWSVAVGIGLFLLSYTAVCWRQLGVALPGGMGKCRR